MMGFTPNSFIVFVIIFCFSLLIFLIKMSWGTLIFFFITNFISLIVTKLLIGNDIFMRKFIDEKFPKEISALTKKKGKK